MRLFLLNSNYDGSSLYTLSSKETKYLEKVLRLEVGISFTAKDKDENYYKATLLENAILKLEKTENPEETLLDSLSPYSGPFFPIDIYISILKGKKNETVVRQLTEIGVRKIVFVSSQYVQEKDFSSHQKERLDTIRKEAVQQSGGKAPIIEGPISFDEAIEKAEGKVLLLHQSLRGKTSSLKEVFCNENFTEKTVSCFVGPEGGFSDTECNKAELSNAVPVLLNTNILRSETSAVYIASAIQALMQN